MPAFKKIAVLGASGLIGQPVVKQLANAGFDLTLVSRDSSKLKSAFPNLSGTKFVQADVSDPSTLKEAFNGTLKPRDLSDVNVGVDVVLSLLGAPALTTQKTFIDAAVEARVKRFIPSEFGCDTQAPYLYIPLCF
jgi:uncharacterized protein YbjT (DUF2867 family)